MQNQTRINVFNETGLLPETEMDNFCRAIAECSKPFNFKVMTKADFEPTSTIFRKFVSPTFECIIYDHGYVIVLEGAIKDAIHFLKLFDETIDPQIIYYLSPAGRMENSDGIPYPRNAEVSQIAKFLDRLFRNTDYTAELG